MALMFYNTLSRKKEIFVPRNEKKVQMFVCGPTVYDFSHIGHAKSYVQFDLIAKYLRYKGFDLFYLQNITDIDDKIIDRANEEEKDPLELAKQFEKEYYKDMKVLGINSINKYARSTDYIGQIIDQIKRLIDKGFAYEIKDGVYFDISKFSDYGKLSKQPLEELNHVRIEPNPEKKNKGDFSLWKKKKENEPSWPSPFGEGRPGWHIEDTAITETEFGPQYDIHGGGIDLIFPHHEAEIAQIEAVSGKKPLVKYWLHNGFLRVNGEKMSKSLGNFVTIKDSLQKFDARVLRLFFLSTHYRSPIDYTEDSLHQTKEVLDRFDNFIVALSGIKKDFDNKEVSILIKKAEQDFEEAMDDDINISGALASLFELMKGINTLIVQNKIGKKNADEIIFFLKKIDSVLSIMKFEQEQLDKEILQLIEQREQARKTKNFTKSDEIRAKLLKMGIQLNDTKDGVTWKKIS
ncbi:MAG: cysteine--tRNA ligase [Candidatus Woesearchaeota archaeon]